MTSGSIFAIQTANMDHSLINLGELLFPFIAQNKVLSIVKSKSFYLHVWRKISAKFSAKGPEKSKQLLSFERVYRE